MDAFNTEMHKEIARPAQVPKLSTSIETAVPSEPTAKPASTMMLVMFAKPAKLVPFTMLIKTDVLHNKQTQTANVTKNTIHSQEDVLLAHQDNQVTIPTEDAKLLSKTATTTDKFKVIKHHASDAHHANSDKP